EHQPAGHPQLRRRAVDHDRGRPLRVLAGEDDRDHPAHRGPVDVSLVDLQRVHQAGEVVRPDLDVVVLDRPVRLAVAAHVVVDDPEMFGELGSGRGEVEVPEARAVDLYDRLALALDVVPELHPVDLDSALHRASWPVTAEYCTMSDIRGRSPR